MNIAETILSRGDEAATAVIHGDVAVTFGELRRNVARLAAGLQARGHSKGDRIGIWSENCPFFVTAYLGIIRAGMVAVPFQSELGAETFVQITRETGMCEVFVSARFFKRLRPWAEAAGVTLVTEADVAGALDDPASRMPDINPVSDLAALMFTSGSTGAPKGVMISHRNIECDTHDIISYLHLRSDDRVMAILPFYYCFGASLLHTHLAAGGSVVLNNQFRLYPEVMLKEMQDMECTGLAGVPSTFQILLRTSRFCQMAFPKLRWFQQAGGKLPDSCIREIVRAFPQVRFYLMYGQTEGTARLSYLPPERLADKLGSIGKGLPSTKLEVLKADGTLVTPGSDETGEIVATGNNVALGYWHDSDETALFFKNGRLHTGDTARVDPDGFIYIVEREREMIKSGGNRVSITEVEEVIAEIPEVIEVAVLGIPHNLLGEAIKACVVLAPNARITGQNIEAICHRRLPSFKTPEEVIFFRNLPHNESGKILKPKLKEMLLERTAGNNRRQE